MKFYFSIYFRGVFLFYSTWANTENRNLKTTPVCSYLFAFSNETSPAGFIGDTPHKKCLKIFLSVRFPYKVSIRVNIEPFDPFVLPFSARSFRDGIP